MSITSKNQHQPIDNTEAENKIQPPADQLCGETSAEKDSYSESQTSLGTNLDTITFTLCTVAVTFLLALIVFKIVSWITYDDAHYNQLTEKVTTSSIIDAEEIAVMLAERYIKNKEEIAGNEDLVTRIMLLHEFQTNLKQVADGLLQIMCF